MPFAGDAELEATSASSPRHPFFRRLYFKIAVTFVVVFVAGTALQVYLATNGWRQLAEELDQQIYWDSAQELADQIAPFVESGFREDRLEPAFLQLRHLNPKVEPYLLDEHGNILYHLPDPVVDFAERVDMEPLRSALQPIAPLLPLYGTDPRRPSERQIFAVGTLRILGNPAYLYLCVRGSLYDYLIRITGQFYVLRTMLSGVALSLTISVIIGLIFFHFLTRHLRALTNAVERFGAGDPSVRASVDSRDEMGQLAAAFNRMADTIKEKTEELQRTDSLRRLFVAHVSHDLRTPLTVMRGFVELLRSKGSVLEATEREKYLTLIEQGVRSATSFVEDLFDLSQLEAEGRKPNREPVAAVELMQSLSAAFRPTAEEKGLRFETDFACRSFVDADPVMLLRVVSNLVSNAIKYTPAPGCVRVAVLEEGNTVRFKVSDTGPGIPVELQERIFEDFYRMKGHREGAEGAGLGLAIVKRMLDLHSTCLKLESRPNAGSLFSFSLPKWS